MIDIEFLINNKDVVKQNIKNKFQDEKLPLVDKVAEMHAKRKKVIIELEDLQHKRNDLSKQNSMLFGKLKVAEGTEKDNILNPIFCGNNSFLTIMEKINDFLRQRDELNCKCTYDLKKDEYVYKNRSRTGDKLIISNSKGEQVNIKLINNNYDIIEQEQDRVKLFITFLAELMGFKPYLDKWNFNNLKLREFSKGILDGKGEHKVLIQKIILRQLKTNAFLWQ